MSETDVMSEAGVVTRAEVPGPPTGNPSPPLRVNSDDLDTDWTQILFQGQPFTGVGYDLHPVEGYVVTEQEYRRGFEWGWVREFSPDGRIESEHHREYAVTHGPFREWYPDGRLKAEGVYEHGIPLWEKQWDEAGALTRDWRLTEDDPKWADLMRWREATRAAKEQVAAERATAEGVTAEGVAAEPAA